LPFSNSSTTLQVLARGDATAPLSIMKSRTDSKPAEELHIRPALQSDLASLIALDEEVTGLAKRKYWKETFSRYRSNRQAGRVFLVAEHDNRIEGFIIGEVRAWEFGEPPCGWVFAIQVRPQTRLKGIGTRLLEALCGAFRRAGIKEMRTLMARDNHLVLSFFRSQGMMAGPLIELESALD
jgi:GNAT superfamily N-acetyltransferase